MTTEVINIQVKEDGSRVVQRRLNDIGDAAEKTEKKLDKLNLKAIAAGAVIGGALAATAGMIIKGFKDAAKSIDDTYKAAKQLGTSTEDYSRLEFAAKSFDITSQQLTSTLEQLQVTQTKAAKPGSELNKLFDQLHISATNADGSLRPTTDLLRDLAGVFEKMPDGANKAALGIKLFGRENQAMVGVLSEGAAKLDELSKNADAMGYTVGTQVANDVHDFYDQLGLARTQLEALYRQALPTIIPLLKKFSELLNSQEFKDGFNTLIKGAADAVTALLKLATTTANVTKFIGEEIAARLHGPELQDTVRIEERIDRLKTTMKAVQDAGPLHPFAIMNASELVPGDLLHQKDTVLKRLQGELDQEQNKLKIGTKLNAEDLARQAKDAGANVAKELEGTVPTIDWSALGGGDGKKSVKKAREEIDHELEQLKDSLRQLQDQADPVGAAVRQLADDHDTLTKAVQRGLIAQTDADKIFAALTLQMRDQLDPLAALNRDIDDRIRLLRLSNDEAQIELQLMQAKQQLQQAGKTLNDEELAQLKAKLTVEQELQRIASARDALQSGSFAGQMKDFQAQVDAIKQLLSDASSGFGQGDVFGALQNMLPWANLDNTQAQMDSYVALHQQMYDQINALRQADVINEQTAQNLKKQADVIFLQNKLKNTADFFGALAGLSQSSNKKLAAIGKAAAIVEATIKGTLAIQEALAAPPGWPYNAGNVIAVTAMQAANLAAIMSQSTGFRTGGEFTVGGSGGSDSQMVAFRATPGEKVSVNTPAQSRALEQGSTAPEVNVPVHIVNVQDPRQAIDAMDTAEGKRVIINQMSSDPAAFKRVLGF